MLQYNIFCCDKTVKDVWRIDVPINRLKRTLAKNFLSDFRATYYWVSTLVLSACGGGKIERVDQIKVIGFSKNYIPPKSNFDKPNNEDPHFKILEPPAVEAYWINSLEMSNGENEIDHLLNEHEGVLKFSFPTVAPSYIPLTISGWAPAGTDIVVASREIFSKLEKVLNVKFEEADSIAGYNNLAISQSIQVGSAGLSYFPNNSYQLGSDIFIAKGYSSPLRLSNDLTNYDYEVLLHEIGHALGLKHPFEDDRNNTATLNSYEDHTRFTAMSYDSDSLTFDGIFRSLDWMTLTKFYGVNPNYNAGDDIYAFDDKNGIFIIDGGGNDTINTGISTEDIFIDLNPGTHSYEGQKSIYITDAKQLTISHGSDIENVQTDSGDDTIIGNNLPNNIKSGGGDDVIFAGEGEDIVYSGLGIDYVDLSEDRNVRDVIVLEQTNGGMLYDTVYGFTQGVSGDAFNIKKLNFPSLTSLPLVDGLNVPSGYVDNCLVRVFGKGLNDVNEVTNAFSNSGNLESLKLSVDGHALFISALSQSTGDVQNLYHVQNRSGSIDVYHLTQLIGNYLDIDNWSFENFII